MPQVAKIFNEKVFSVKQKIKLNTHIVIDQCEYLI